MAHGYYPCPECQFYFNNFMGCIDHMITEHWWEPGLAQNYWSSNSANHDALL